jgi:peptidoglycan/LPS O-acetylase OafA/YrhL
MQVSKAAGESGCQNHPEAAPLVMGEPEYLPPRFPELDGLRGVAILLVMFFHFGAYTPEASSTLQTIIAKAIGLGWSGVDLFFVLSGFLITGILVDSKGLPNYLTNFYIRRILRIFPLYYCSVAFLFWVVPLVTSDYLHWGWPKNWPPLSSSEQVWYWLHISNWRTAFVPLAYPPATPFWSLAIEEQFYVFWPLLILALSRTSLWRFCRAIMALACIARNLPWAQSLGAAYPESLYRLTPFRIDTLLFVASAALIIRSQAAFRPLKRWILPLFFTGCAVLGVVIFSAGSTSPYSGPMTRFGYTALGLICASLVLGATSQSGGPVTWKRFLRLPILRHFGKYSYAMYVIHAPVHLILSRIFFSFGGGFFSALGTIAFGIAITDQLARLSWFALEAPFLALKDRFAPASVQVAGR